MFSNLFKPEISTFLVDIFFPSKSNRKTENFSVEPTRNIWPEVVEEVITNDVYKSYEQDFTTTKQKQELSGKQYTKQDYCKMIDNKADFHIYNTKELFEKLYF